MLKICVVTGARSEYGLLYWLMKEAQQSPDWDLQIVATGMHLSPEFDLSYRQILADGFELSDKVEMLLSSDSHVGITKSIGLGVIGFADCFERLQADVLILLGDRTEIFAAAQAALIAKLPIAHIHGGELSMHAYDDAIRHSITKMAQFHFVAAQAYRERVIQLGEDPARVFQVGPCVLDSIRHFKGKTRTELEACLGCTLSTELFLITYHPETLGHHASEWAFSELLTALSYFDTAQFIFTKANSDAGGRIINEMMEAFCAAEKPRAQAFVQLGHENYLSLLSHARVVIGNSSSGIIEAPFFQVPTVNIGGRQKGRLRANSVIDCHEQSSDIVSAISQALDMHQSMMAETKIPDTGETVAKQILNILKKQDLKKSIQKTFYDTVREKSNAR